MNNFFLLNESLRTETIVELEEGIYNLNEIIVSRDKELDSFLKHDSIWYYDTGHGLIVDLYYSVVKEETQRLAPLVFDRFLDCPHYIENEEHFDTLFANQCNGFTGISFTKLQILLERQIINKEGFIAFKTNFIIKHAFDSIESFWANKEFLYPNLRFCDQVLKQIEHLSIEDDRFRQIEQKLEKLNAFTSKWGSGLFDFKRLGLDCSPDTPTRIKNTLALRTFECPSVGNRVFSYHIKWSVGREPFRLYFVPEQSNYKVYVGYIGGKADIGFA